MQAKTFVNSIYLKKIEFHNQKEKSPEMGLFLKISAYSAG